MEEGRCHRNNYVWSNSVFYVMEEKINTFALTKQDTAVLKGIAIVAMLMHHVWGCAPSWVEPYTGVLGFLGNVGKVCVAIFLFCSGYGLSVGYSKVMEACRLQGGDWKNGIKATLKFLAKRFVKLYAGYWPIFLIFVPIGVLLFGRSLSVVYGDSQIGWSLLRDILGIGGWNSYNITWWFNRLIVILYLSFPIIYWCCRYVPWIILPISMGIMLFDYKLPAIGDYEIIFWQCPFVYGILWHKWQGYLGRVHHILSKYLGITLLILFFVLAVLCYCRIKHVINPILHYDFSGLYVDPFITVAIVTIISIVPKIPLFTSVFAFFGKHSMNIYMTHTFFFSYWFTGFFYSCELGGGMNIMALLIICILISLIIEWLKQKTKWNECTNNFLIRLDRL